jgi:hypothetical protein
MKDYAYCSLSELVGDFIEDENGIWWLINIRAFLLETSPNMNLRLITNYGEEENVSKTGWTPQQRQVNPASYIFNVAVACYRGLSEAEIM